MNIIISSSNAAFKCTWETSTLYYDMSRIQVENKPKQNIYILNNKLKQLSEFKMMKNVYFHHLFKHVTTKQLCYIKQTVKVEWFTLFTPPQQWRLRIVLLGVLRVGGLNS